MGCRWIIGWGSAGLHEPLRAEYQQDRLCNQDYPKPLLRP
jgi:hypothetical protein